MTPRTRTARALQSTFLSLATAILVLTFAAPASAAVPHQAVIEGVIHSAGGGPIVDGSYPLVYALYATKTGGKAIWTESSATDVFGGIFVHALGINKPLPVAPLESAKQLWLSLRVGSDPELPRTRVWAAPYSLVAERASTATTAKSADVAKALACTGCVSLKALKIDGGLNLLGNELKAKVVSASVIQASSFVGDGSKLTGIKTPAGTCKVAGQVVKGIAPNGSLICVKSMDPSALPKDGLENISNGVLSNYFDDNIAGKGNIPLPDNNPPGISSELFVPDLGTALQLDIHVKVKNSDLSTVLVIAYDPNNVGYVLWDKTAKGTALDGMWPSKNKVVKGNLKSWIGKNPKGKWRLKVADMGFKNNKFDGELTSWSIIVRTLAHKKVLAKGDIMLQNGAGSQLPAARVARKYAAALADGGKLLLDSGSPTPALLAQAWFYDTVGKRWVQANAGSAGGSCTACGTGGDGNYVALKSVTLPGKIYSFRNFTIVKGVTVTATGSAALHIKATEKIDIQGTLLLNGGAGSNVSNNSGGCYGGASKPGKGGPGGYDGGYGKYSPSSAFYDGKGPGAGKKGAYNWNGGCGSGGGGAGYGSGGSNGQGSNGAGGGTYSGIAGGQLIGGSGGGAGGYGSSNNATGGGGGGGGGAVRLDAPEVVVAGKVSANGGKGGGQYNNCDGGTSGGGSGGAIWIRGGTVALAGSSLTAVGGAGGSKGGSGSCGGVGGKGGNGRIRVDALKLASNGSASPGFTKGETTGLGMPLANRFSLDQPKTGQVRLTNESGQKQQVWLVATW